MTVCLQFLSLVMYWLPSGRASKQLSLRQSVFGSGQGVTLRDIDDGQHMSRTRLRSGRGYTLIGEL